MLTPDEVNGYAGLMAAPWDELSERILRDMVRRIVKAGKITSTAEWQSFRAQALGASRAYLLRQMQAIAQELGPQEAAVFARAMQQAYNKDLLTEGQLAQLLRIDRTELRRILDMLGSGDDHDLESLALE